MAGVFPPHYWGRLELAWDDDLDQESEAYAIASDLSVRVRVLAGPGTGKSFAMKRRVARLLEGGVDPATILPVTFTRVAAEDLHRELVGMGAPGCDELEGVTLHSLSLKLLTRNHVLEATGRFPRPLNQFELGPLEADLNGHGGKRKSGRRSRPMRQLGLDSKRMNPDLRLTTGIWNLRSNCWTGSPSIKVC